MKRKKFNAAGLPPLARPQRIFPTSILRRCPECGSHTRQALVQRLPQQPFKQSNLCMVRCDDCLEEWQSRVLEREIEKRYENGVVTFEPLTRFAIERLAKKLYKTAHQLKKEAK